MSKKSAEVQKSREKSQFNQQYNKNFDKDDDWWSELLEHHDVADVVGQFERADMLTLDEGRAALPMSSSP